MRAPTPALAIAVSLGAAAGSAFGQVSACADCHPRQAQEWAGSRHARAFTNDGFAASYRRAPSPWCLTCHRPEGRDELGVGCASCHAGPHPGAASRSPAGGAAAACARCHQFDLPTRQTRHLARPRSAGVPLQDTVAEHRAAGAAACPSCHLARGGHTFPGAYDVEWLKASVQHEACVAADGSVELWVRALGVGHHLPTGDPFRRLVARVCADERCALALTHVQLERALSHQRPPRVGYDTALRPNDTARYHLPIAAGYTLPASAHLELSYRYADPTLEAALAPAEVVAVLADTALTACPEGAPRWSSR